MKTLIGLTLSLTACALADTYPRQPGIDALHYIFRVTLSDESDAIAAETTADIRFVQDGVTQVALDLTSVSADKGMTVTSVQSNTPVTWSHTGDRLTIKLPAAPKAGERRQFTVAYHGVAG